MAVTFYTYRKDVPLKPGQVVHYTKGRGYWAYTPPVVPPPPPPPAGVQLPVGPFVSHNTEQYFGRANPPQTIKGLDIENVKGANSGLLVMQWPPAKSTGPWTIHDIIVQTVGNVPPTSDGTSEAGIWIGQPANLDRFVADGSWEALWTGAMCADSVISNGTIGRRDSTGGFSMGSQAASAGVYDEHCTRRTLFTHLDVNAPNARFGFVSEWWYQDATYAAIIAAEYPGVAAGKAGSCMNTYDTIKVYCPRNGYGIFFDAGTWGNVTRNIHFYGPGAAYCAPNHLAGPTDNYIDVASCTFEQTGPNVSKHNNAIGLHAPTDAERLARRLQRPLALAG